MQPCLELIEKLEKEAKKEASSTVQKTASATSSAAELTSLFTASMQPSTITSLSSETKVSFCYPATSLALSAAPAAQLTQLPADVNPSSFTYTTVPLTQNTASYYPGALFPSQDSSFFALGSCLGGIPFNAQPSTNTSTFDAPIDVTGYNASDTTTDLGNFLGNSGFPIYQNPSNFTDPSQPIASFDSALLYPNTATQLNQWSPQDPFALPTNLFNFNANIQLPNNYQMNNQFYPQNL